MPTPSLRRAAIEFIGVHGYDERYRCLVCGQEWQPLNEPGAGRFYRGWWHCPNGCNVGITARKAPGTTDGASLPR
jgi:hypothetical protein